MAEAEDAAAPAAVAGMAAQDIEREVLVAELAEVRGLSEAQRGECVAALQLVALRDGQVLVRAGEAAECAFVITKGRLVRAGPDEPANVEAGSKVEWEALLVDDMSRTCTLTALGDVRAWKLAREDYKRIVGVAAVLQRNAALAQLGSEALRELASSLRRVRALAGTVLLRHGKVNKNLYFIEEGEVVGTIRDGGVSSLLTLQREGEVIWRYGKGQVFGEDPLVLHGQISCTTDAVVTSDTALLIQIPHEAVMAAMRHESETTATEVLGELRVELLTRLLHALHDYSAISTDSITEKVARRAHLLAFEAGSRLNVDDLAEGWHSRWGHGAARNEAIVLVVTQGALQVTEVEQGHGGERHHKAVGRLEVGHSCSFDRLFEHGLQLTTNGSTCLVIVPSGASVPTRRPSLLRQCSSGMQALCFGSGIDTPPALSPSTEAKRLKRALPALSSQDLGPEGSETGPADADLNKKKRQACCRAPDGYASVRKSRKQLKFLEKLNPVSTSAPPRDRPKFASCPVLPFMDPSTGQATQHALRKSTPGHQRMAASSTTAATAAAATTANNSSSNAWGGPGTSAPAKTTPTAGGFSFKLSSPVRFYRGNTSPKKRKSGLVLSLSGLEKVEVLGQGAFGTVNLVRHKSSNIVYALKQLDKNKVMAQRQEHRVQSERSIMERFGKHPFITSFIRTFRDSQNVYLLLEAGLGGDLFDLIAKRKTQSLSMEETLFFAPQVVMALQFLHEHQVVYRDLKPENAVLCVDGYLRLTDFGMAKEIGKAGRTYTLCGTPTFLAPEILTLGGYDCSIDWWALGVFLYEVSTGSFPFHAKSMVSLRMEHKAYEAEYPGHSLFTRLQERTKSDAFVSLCRGTLCPDPAARLGRHAQTTGVTDVRGHPFFASVDWDALLRHEVCPPLTVFECVSNSRVLAATSALENKSPSPRGIASLLAPRFASRLSGFSPGSAPVRIGRQDSNVEYEEKDWSEDELDCERRANNRQSSCQTLPQPPVPPAGRSGLRICTARLSSSVETASFSSERAEVAQPKPRTTPNKATQETRWEQAF